MPPVDVLALYDIHGNLDALEAVLADPRASRPDAVVVGGDAVPGPFAAATLVIVAMARSQPVGRPQVSVAVNGAILALHWVTFFAAVKIATVAVALLGYASFPLFVHAAFPSILTGRVRPGARATAVRTGSEARRIGHRHPGRGGPCRARPGFQLDQRYGARPCARRPVGVHLCAALRA